jgi:hypothetical protein
MSAAPHSLYIRFLASKGILDAKNINCELERLGIKEVSENIVDDQQRTIMELLPEVKSKNLTAKKKHNDWLKWMKILDVYEARCAEDAYKNYDQLKSNAFIAARDILYDHKLSISINALLIKKVNYSTIAQSMNIRYQLGLTDLILKVYQKYFFNSETMHRSDWREYLKGCNDWEQHVYFTALTDSVDAVKFEIGLPASVKVTDELGFLLNKSFQKSKEHLRANTPTSAAEARKWIGVSLSLADKYEKYRDADTTDFGNALELELTHEREDFVQAEDILGKDHNKKDPSNDPDEGEEEPEDGQLSLPNMDVE